MTCNASPNWRGTKHSKPASRPIPSLSQDEPLPGGYLGARITASLSTQPHLSWATDECATAVTSILNLPIPSQTLIPLLGYQGPAKIAHTHHLTNLTWADIARLDATLLRGVKHFHKLPKSFPRIALHAPVHELGLNFPSIWEDYSAAAAATWCRILNDTGILGRAARDSLTTAAGEYRHWPVASALPNCPFTLGRVAAILLTSNLLPTGGPDIWLGCQISHDLIASTPPVLDERGVLVDPQPYPPTHDTLHRLTPLWTYNVLTWDHLLYRPRGSTARVMTIEEFTTRRSHMGLPPPPPPLLGALKYIQCLLLSSSLREFRTLRCSLTKSKLHPTMAVAAVWSLRPLRLQDLPSTTLPQTTTAAIQRPLTAFTVPVEHS